MMLHEDDGETNLAVAERPIAVASPDFQPRECGLERRPVEWPTVGLAATIYGGWAALTYWHEACPLWILVPAGAWLIAWHSSLQHEILHGHPTRWRRLNAVLGVIPLSLWLPFHSYKISHLTHHRDERLTDPLDDPESLYWTPGQWRALGPLARFFMTVQSTLLGRLVLGPAWTIGRFLNDQGRQILAGRRVVRKIWIIHLFYVAVTILWLTFVCHMSLVFYALAIVYPGTSLLLVRSFAEHRAHFGVCERTAIVEHAPILGLLFLYNNLHAAHHEAPSLPWYRIPGWYRRNRERLIRQNGGLVYRSYVDIARRFLLRPHAMPLHPLGRAPYADGHVPAE
jgi:fatty acid desaturase